MQKNLLIIIATVVLVSASMVFAVDDPHGTTNSIYCEQCHINHNSMGDILTNATDSLVATLCLSCHTPGGWVPMSKTLSTKQQADPGTIGTSHAWDAPADNADLGASLPTTQALLDHLTLDDRITCGTCHDPHSNSNSPFLRLDNSADALCLDCHAGRDNSDVKTYTGNELSHPVGIALPSDADFHNPPLDVDGVAQPNDGNLTNDFALLAGDVVSCTTCHGVHYSDSNSGTTDGP